MRLLVATDIASFPCGDLAAIDATLLQTMLLSTALLRCTFPTLNTDAAFPYPQACQQCRAVKQRCSGAAKHPCERCQL